MPDLTESRSKAARAALRAHHERTHAPKHWLTDKARFDPARNPDLAGNLTDLIADVLIEAQVAGLDVLKITSAALSHVPGADMTAAHHAVGRVIARRDEPAA